MMGSSYSLVAALDEIIAEPVFLELAVYPVHDPLVTRPEKSRTTESVAE